MKKWKTNLLHFDFLKFWRINLVLVLIVIFGAALISRLVFVQILNQDFYKALAIGQQKFFGRTFDERGKIFFKNGEVLATNINSYYLYTSPIEVKEKEKTAEVLAKLLNLNQDQLLEKFKKNSLFELIKNRLTDLEVEKIKKLDLAGIYLKQEKIRYYPQGKLASKIVGFLGGEGRGQYGLEEYWDEFLQPKKEWEKRGLASFAFFLENKNQGADLILTIDYNLQYQAEKLLQQAHNNLNIEEGQVIVMEPQTGKILALADFPSFDPNQYEKYARDLKIFQNGAIQKIFEPGSILKPITMAAALNEGKITPQTTYIDEGKVKIGNWTIYNYDGRIWGKKTMTEVLEKSINTGAVFVEKLLLHPVFLDYINRFGFFRPTGIDLPGEIFSQNRELKKGYEINFATASFGQGIEVTPIQLARAFSAIANGGKLIKPYLVEKIVKEGKIIKEVEPQISEDLVISPKTASKLTAMLVSVVENGFGKGARIPGYYIAGKTGTAQIAYSALGINKPGYSEKTIQSFVGFAPAFNPQFLILIKLNNPQTKTAEYSAVPLFKKLAKYIIDYYQIPPDYE